jgi:hypothetical protein
MGDCRSFPEAADGRPMPPTAVFMGSGPLAEYNQVRMAIMGGK